MSAPRPDYVEFGCMSPSIREQHPVIPAHDAIHFDKDAEAITRLSARGLITRSQADAACKKLAKKIGDALGTVRRSTRRGEAA